MKETKESNKITELAFERKEFKELASEILRNTFYNLLLEHHEKEMEHQRLLLDAELRHWRGETEQTDDILVMGVRVA